MKKYIVYLMLFCFVSNADETDPFFGEKGTILQKDAWVFSSKKTKEIRDRLIDLDTQTKLNESLNKSIDLYKSNDQLQQNKINLLLEQNDKLAQRLNDSQSLNNWEKFGLFVLGIAATVGAGIAIKKAGQ